MLREYDDVEPVILSGKLFLAASTFKASVRAFYLVFWSFASDFLPMLNRLRFVNYACAQLAKMKK
jgi:hypothetical protein